MYTNYVQNFNQSIALLSTLNKKAAIAKFLRVFETRFTITKQSNNSIQDCREDPRCKNLDLSSFLIMPGTPSLFPIVANFFISTTYPSVQSSTCRSCEAYLAGALRL